MQDSNNIYLPAEEIEELKKTGVLSISNEEVIDFQKINGALHCTKNRLFLNGESCKSVASQENGLTNIIKCDSNVQYLSSCMEATPEGIIECTIPNIGVIELELGAQRNSIIILTSTEDIEQYIQDNKYYVVKHDDIKGALTKEAVDAYINQEVYKKFLIYPQDIPQLLSILKEVNDYFFVIEDMDILLYKNIYKQNIESIMDYYFMFPKTNRCFYTSDATIFNSPFLKNEKRSIIQWHNYKDRKLNVYSHDNIIGTLTDIIQHIPFKEKVIIVYTSPIQAKIAILNLPKNIQRDCSIICSEYNKRIAGDYYSSKEDNILTTVKRISFWAIPNYFNMKFKDEYHLITVSDATRGSTTLSLKQIQLIFYLNKNSSQTILSDTVVYNKTAYYDVWEEDYEKLLERATKIVQLTDAADILSTEDSSLKNIFELAKSVIKERAKGKITGKFAPFSLIRRNINGKSVIAYMNFDSMKFRTNLIQKLYSGKLSLADKLNEMYTVPHYYDQKIIRKTTEKQKQIECEEKKAQKKYKREDRISCLKEIEEIYDMDKLNAQWLSIKSKTGNVIQRKTFEEVISLYDYIDTKELLSLLKNLKAYNSIEFKNLNNAIIYWALEEEHPLKIAVSSTFIIGGKYTNKEIVEKMLPIIHYHLHKDLSSKKRKVISIFKNWVKANRPKNHYIVQTDDRFSSHKNRISKEENNLLKLFKI